LASCAKNPFSTRPTEPPVGSAGTWETPQAADVVIRNLLFAYNERIISNYQLCFSDSFIFSAPEDSIDAVNNGRPDLFTNWDKRAEISNGNNIFQSFTNSDTMSLYLTLSPSSDHADFIEDTSAVVYRKYSLKVISVHAGQPDTLTAAGLATFHLKPEGLNWWTIRWWEDLPVTSGAFSWADFKAGYRQ
jgi:hypothetical protein